MSHQNPSEIAKCGHSKSYEHHLRQVVYSLFIGGETGMPYWFDAHPGNRHDSKNIKAEFDALENITVLVGDDGSYWCFDKGEKSEELLRKLDDANIGFVTSAKINEFQPTVDYALNHFEILDNSKRNKKLEEEENAEDRVLAYTETVNYCGRLRRVVVTLSPALKRKQLYTFDSNVEDVTNFIAECKLNIRSGKKGWKNEADVRKQIAKYFKKPAKASFKDIYDISFTVTSNGLKMYASKNYSNINQLKKYLGISIKVCSNIDLSAGEIDDIYTGRWHVEHGFKVIKTKGGLQIRPLRHWTDNNILIYLTIKYFAFIGRQLIEKMMNDAGCHITAERVFEELGKINCSVVEKVSKHHRTVTEYHVDYPQNQLQQFILSVFGYEIKKGNILREGQKESSSFGLHKPVGAPRKESHLSGLDELNPRPWRKIVQEWKNERKKLAAGEESNADTDKNDQRQESKTTGASAQSDVKSHTNNEKKDIDIENTNQSAEVGVSNLQKIMSENEEDRHAEKNSTNIMPDMLKDIEALKSTNSNSDTNAAITQKTRQNSSTDNCISATNTLSETSSASMNIHTKLKKNIPP
jgi:transposase